jgi:hypothetical protein
MFRQLMSGQQVRREPAGTARKKAQGASPARHLPASPIETFLMGSRSVRRRALCAVSLTQVRTSSTEGESSKGDAGSSESGSRRKTGGGSSGKRSGESSSAILCRPDRGAQSQWREPRIREHEEHCCSVHEPKAKAEGDGRGGQRTVRAWQGESRIGDAPSACGRRAGQSASDARSKPKHPLSAACGESRMQASAVKATEVERRSESSLTQVSRSRTAICNG